MHIDNLIAGSVRRAPGTVVTRFRTQSSSAERTDPDRKGREHSSFFSFAGIVGFAADIGPFYAFPSSAGYFPVIGVAAGPAVILTVPGYGYSRSALESE
jgi:hypothetical protein